MSAKTNLLFLFLAMAVSAKCQRFSVLIHEIMADPQPVVRLPDAEYIELRNNSTAAINLAGWRLQTASAISGAFPAFTLQPDSFVVVSSRTNAALFGSNTLGLTSFPALPNSGTTLVLLNARGEIVHAVDYQSGWYQNGVKAAGGWSLEMVDASNPCAGAANWKAAVDPRGGTPGSTNSVRANNKDEQPPALLSVIVQDSTRLLLQFDEPLDSAGAALASRYRLEPQVQVTAAVPVRPLFQQVVLQLQKPLQPQLIYTVTASGISDCSGNGIGSRNQAPVGIPQLPQPGDVVINEILFNPKPGGADYVELYNRSKKVIDAGRLWMSNNNTALSQTNLQQISAFSLYLFPESYAVVTENKDAVMSSFLVKHPEQVWQVAALPSLPDDKGSFVLQNEQGAVVDELSYHQNWHFALLADPDGVALERIDTEKATQDKNNWTSAAAAAGAGTPTYRNSQFRQAAAGGGVIEISPAVFSPDQDGFEDFCTINYQLDAPGYMGNLRIFDAGGRQVRYLVQNQSLTQSGYWRWDGLSDKGQALPSGTYILLIELFNQQGKTRAFKKTIALARRP